VFAQYGEPLPAQVVSEPQLSAQEPFAQTCPATQAVPQAPQLALSVRVFAQNSAPLTEQSVEVPQFSPASG
jgi:hypothetical protein